MSSSCLRDSESDSDEEFSPDESGFIPIGDYLLFGDPISRGGFGEVWKGKRRDGSGTTLAFKRVTPKEKQPLNLREALILQQLDSPYIIKFKDAFIYGSSFFLCMEYASGGTLRDWINERKGKEVDKFYLDEVIDNIASVFLGVRYIHDRGFIHRDLKPENILFDGAGDVKIGDFGLSRYLPDRRCAETQCGTRTYESPEMLTGVGVTRTTDVWSLGCILFEMLFQRHPFCDEEGHFIEDDAKKGISEEDVPALDGKTGLNELVVGMLKSDPSERYTIYQCLGSDVIAQYISNSIDDSKEVSRVLRECSVAGRADQPYPSPGEVINKLAKMAARKQ